MLNFTSKNYLIIIAESPTEWTKLLSWDFIFIPFVISDKCSTWIKWSRLFYNLLDKVCLLTVGYGILYPNSKNERKKDIFHSDQMNTNTNEE